jgi:hypothetical protein
MLLIVPIIAGLLACMPEMAPVGDPDRAKIDPELSGVWVLGDEESVESVYYFEPYDKRTWLIVGVAVEEGDDLDPVELVTGDYDSLVRIMLDKDRGVGNKGVTGGRVELYKAWLTKLAGETFLTWSPLGVINEEGTFGIEFAYNWRLRRIDPEHLTLQFIDVEGPVFEDIDMTNRRALEKVIRRHADEEGFFDDDVFPLMKVQPEHLQAFGDLLGSVVSDI